MVINFCLSILLMLCFVQDETNLPADFSTLQKISIEELKLKTQAHEESWGIGRASRWGLDQGTGELIFSFADGIKAVAPAQIIGTYNTEDQTWLWAWDNPSIDEKLRRDALKVRKYGEAHHID